MTTPRYSWHVSPQHAARFLAEAYMHEVSMRGRAATMNDLQRDYISKVATWLTSSSPLGLIINGGTGCGKTTLVQALSDVIDIVSSGVKVKYVTAPELAAYARKDEEMYDACVKSQVLIIDDIGTEAATVKNYGTEISPIVDVLSARYAKYLMTICTTNLKREKFRDAYGARIASRSDEMFAWLTQRNPDWRSEKR